MVKRALLSLLSGTLFGFGLAISGMMDPARVRGFLDILGVWDPTLAFVMGGALAVMAVAWLVQRRVAHPLADASFHLPGTSKLDFHLIGGAALFGIGWGIGGLCPGPGIASLGGAHFAEALVFVIAMLAGMWLHRMVVR